MQIRVDSHKDITYRTVEDIQRDIRELSAPLRRIAPLLLNMTFDHENAKPQQQVDAQEDNDAGLLDDAEVKSGS